MDVPKGFAFAGGHVGIKDVNDDIGIAVADRVCVASAMFTKNLFCGECIPLGKQAVSNHRLQGVIVTSGIANVATGEEGRRNELRLIDKLASLTNISPEDILPSSTGMIGPQLPVDTILQGMPAIANQLSPEHFMQFAKGIITTDTAIKTESRGVGEATILATAKGAGMIEPNMATMLVYIFTDAIVPDDRIDGVLRQSVDMSFNSMSVDTDTSTSDTVALLSSGIFPVDLDEFQSALNDVCVSLCRQIVAGAEGAKHTIEVVVDNCATEEEAKRIGKSIVNSPLVKTAIYGGDPNWGRIIMALGKTPDIRLDKTAIRISIGDSLIFEDEKEVTDNVEAIRRYLQTSKVIVITVDMNSGRESHRVFGCDLTEEYIRINSYYTT